MRHPIFALRMWLSQCLLSAGSRIEPDYRSYCEVNPKTGMLRYRYEPRGRS